MATVLCNCGAAWLNQLMNATIASTTYFVGWGEGGGTAAKADTQVSSEAQARVSAGQSISAYNQMQWIAVMTASAVRSITNAGLFHNNSGTLLVHGDFGATAVNTNDRIEFTVTLTTSGV